MRIYFLSEVMAALKLNGAYLGAIDGFERFVELDPRDNVLAEVVPDGGLRPVAFFINDGLFKTPPDFLDVYLTDGDAVVAVKKFATDARPLSVIAQYRLGATLVTLFCEGGGYHLGCEGKACNLYDLPQAFAHAKLFEARVGGLPVVVVEGEKYLCIISADGRRVFFNPCESYTLGERLKIVVAFPSCQGLKAQCTFSYDGEKFTLDESVTSGERQPDPSVLHFAFFESVLTKADCSQFLCDDLKARAGELSSFLGDFVDVVVPHARFYETRGDLRAAGLVYPLSDNLFSVKYFAVDLDDGKITNVYEVQD